MRNPKEESSLLAKSNDWRDRSGLLAGIVCLAALAGCSGGETRPPDDGLAEISVPEAVVEEAPTPEPELEVADESDEPDRRSRRERRRERRAANEESRDENRDEARSEAGDEAVVVPELAAVAFERALAAMQRQDWTEAELELEQLVLEFDGLAGPWVNLAMIYANDGRDQEALDALDRALEINPDHAVALNQRGILLREQGQFEAAEQAYRSAIAAEPMYALAHYNLGVLLDLYARRHAEALEAYENYQSLLAEPDETVARWIIDLRRRLGINEQSARVAGENGG
jgi:tetratricopeptide (TPR) repeat protein